VDHAPPSLLEADMPASPFSAGAVKARDKGAARMILMART